MSNHPMSTVIDGEVYVSVSCLADILTATAEAYERGVVTPSYDIEQGLRDRVANGIRRGKASAIRMVRDELKKGLTV